MKKKKLFSKHDLKPKVIKNGKKVVRAENHSNLRLHSNSDACSKTK